MAGVRYLNLHEYQSKELMAKYNVAVQKFRTAETAEEAAANAASLSACVHAYTTTRANRAGY